MKGILAVSAVALSTLGWMAAADVRITISPTNVFMAARATQQFTAMVTGTANSSVTWTATGGTITSGGVFTAPQGPRIVDVTARSEADPAKSAIASVVISTYEQLPSQACIRESSLRSIEGVASTTIQFVNFTSQDIQVYWLNYEGRRVLYKTLTARENYLQSTFLTHPWVVTDTSGRCLGIFLPSATLTSAVIFGPPEIKLVTAPPVSAEAGSLIELDASRTIGKAPLRFIWSVRSETANLPFSTIAAGKISFTTGSTIKKVTANLTVEDADGRQSVQIIQIDIGQSPETRVITTAAGGYIGDNGPATAASLSFPRYMAKDQAGNLFISDSIHNRIRKVDRTGTISTVAGIDVSGYTGDGGPGNRATLHSPAGIVFDSAGNLLIADRFNNVVRKLTPAGIISTIAGTGVPGYTGDRGPATQATLNSPFEVALDSSGNLYVADAGNNVIRKVNSSGIITTVAGTGVAGFDGDGGPAIAAKLNFPRSVLLDGRGNLFVNDARNRRVRRVDTSGVITTFAGNGNGGSSGDGGLATQAPIGNPRSLGLDASGNLLISSASRVRRVDASGIIFTLAGSGSGFNGDGNTATATQFSSPTGLLLDAGSLLLADSGNGRIRSVDASGKVTTIAGGFVGDGNAAALAALNAPEDICIDPSGNLIIADTDHHRIRKVEPSGKISTLAGIGFAGYGGDGGAASSAKLNYPLGVACDAAGNVYISDDVFVRKVDRTGIIRTIAGNGEYGYTGDGGPATAAKLGTPGPMVVEGSGNVYMTDEDFCVIRKIDTAGVISTFAGNGQCDFRGDGGPATAASLDVPLGITVDASGNVYIADTYNHRVRKVSKSGVITSIAGTGENGFGGDNGSALSAQLSYPSGLQFDSAGNLYVADWGNNRIRRIDASGLITTIAGTGEFGFAGDEGPAAAAQFEGATALAVDASNNLYVADDLVYRVRRISTAGSSSPPPEIKFATKPPTNADVGTTVTLDASRTTGKAPLQFLWTVTYDSVNIQFTVVAAGKISFIVPAAAAGKKIIVSLSVTDSDGRQSSQSVDIQVYPQAQDDPASVKVGYAVLTPDVGQPAPAGTAVFSLTQNNILVSEAGVPSASPILAARIFADINPPAVNTGAAIANPNDQPARVVVTLVSADGSIIFGSQNLIIPARGHAAKFANELLPNVAIPIKGVLNLSSDIPVAVITLRQSINERGEVVLTTMPVADLRAPQRPENAYLAQIGDGGGITTQIVLVNPANVAITGKLVFLDPNGAPMSIKLGNETATTFTYTVPASGVVFAETGGAGDVKVGSVAIRPDPGVIAPVATAVFRVKSGGTLVTEAAIAALKPTNTGRIFVDVTPYKNTGVAIHNPNSVKLSLKLKLKAAGEQGTAREATLELPPFGQTARFVTELFPGTTSLFQGTLDITGNSGFVAVTLRQNTNRRRDTLLTTLPVADLTQVVSSSTSIFPQVGVAESLSTEFILINTDGAKSAGGTLAFFKSDGTRMKLPVAGERNESSTYSIGPARARRIRAEVPIVGVTDESGQVRLNVLGQDLTFTLVDKDTRNPIGGLTVAVAMNTASSGLLLAVDPLNQYPLQIVQLASGTGATKLSLAGSGERQEGALLPLASDPAQVLVPVTLKSTAAIPTVVIKKLETVRTPFELLDSLAFLLNVADAAGVPVGELAGKLGLTEVKEVTEEEARKELRTDLALGLSSKILLLAGTAGAGGVPLGLGIAADLVNYALDDITINECTARLGAKLKKVTVKLTNGNLHFLKCEPPSRPDTDASPVSFKAVKKDSLETIPIDDIEFINKKKITLGIKGPPAPNGVVTTNVPRGPYRVTLRAPGFCPESVDITVPDNSSTTVQFDRCPMDKLVLAADRLTGFLAPGAQVNFQVKAKDIKGLDLFCDSDFFVINPPGSQVASIVKTGPDRATLTAGPDNGAARVIARCKGMTSNAILVSGTGEGPPGPSQDHRLSVTTEGQGTVTSTDGRINCGTQGSICSVLYPANTTVTLRATPDSGWQFDGWSGECAGKGDCTVTLNVSPGKAVRAKFVQIQSTVAGTYKVQDLFMGSTTDTGRTSSFCTFQHSISATITIVVQGGNGTASDPYRGTLSTSAKDVVTVLKDNASNSCLRLYYPSGLVNITITGAPITGSSGKLQASGFDPDTETTWSFSDGTFSGNTLTGTVKISNSIFDAPINKSVSLPKIQ